MGSITYLKCYRLSGPAANPTLNPCMCCALDLGLGSKSGAILGLRPHHRKNRLRLFTEIAFPRDRSSTGQSTKFMASPAFPCNLMSKRYHSPAGAAVMPSSPCRGGNRMCIGGVSILPISWLYGRFYRLTYPVDRDYSSTLCCPEHYVRRVIGVYRTQGRKAQ